MDNPDIAACGRFVADSLPLLENTRMKFRQVVAAILSLFFMPLAQQSHAQDYQEGLVETRILDFDPQSGVKSQHFYFIDFEKKSVTSAFSSGTTRIDLYVTSFDVDSIRDNFKVTDVSFSEGEVKFALVGSTASKVMVMPNIDYRLRFRATKSGQVSVEGCHDGYPAYLIQHQGKNIYSFRHERLDLIKLFGPCDISVNVN